MSAPKWLTRRALVGWSLGLLLAGCGWRPSEIVAVSSDERGLLELANAYRGYSAKNKRGPKSLGDLNIRGQQNPVAVRMIKSGDLIVQWGATPSPGGEATAAILAYTKTVPEQGGHVLLADCKTIKKFTADEFKAAEKANGK